TRPEGTPAPVPAPVEDDEESVERVVVEVGGKRLEVVLPAGLGLGGNNKPKQRRPRRSGTRVSAGAGGGNALAIPMQGTIVKVAVADGDVVAEGDLVVVLEAMKMEQPLVAHRPGKIHGLTAAPGQTVSAGGVICQIDDVESA